MSQTQSQPTDDAQSREQTLAERTEQWVLEDAGDERPLEVSGTVSLNGSVRVPKDATEDEKKQALVTQVLIDEIDDISGVTIWEQEFMDGPVGLDHNNEND